MKNFLKKLNIFNRDKSPSALSGSNYYPGNFGGLSGGAKYYGGLSNYGYSKYIANTRTRQNARSAFHDSPEAKAVVNRFADTVVDTGLKLECTPNAEILGISREEAESWARDVEARFDMWASSKESDRRGLSNFYQTQRLYQISQQRDNDQFARFYYSKDRNLSSPLQVSVIDPNQIAGDSITSTWTQSSLRDGIERNEKGEEVAYHVRFRNEKSGEIDTQRVPKKGRISKRTMMIHGFAAEYAGQKRGYSRLEHVLQEFEEITDFKLSTIKKAISQSQITMYVKPSNENPASNPLEDLASFKSGPTVADPAEIATKQGAPVDLAGCPVTYDNVPEATLQIPGEVGVFNLNKGEDLKTFPTQASSEAFNEFIEAYMSYVSASSGMPLEVLLMKFGQNYSASRGALLLFWRVVQIWRNEMTVDFLNPVFESWLSEEIAAGRIKAPGFKDPVLKKAWIQNRWVGAPMPNIDPQRTAKAEMMYLEMGATNLDRVARDFNGSDGASNRQKLARQYDELPIAKWNRKEETEENENSED